MAHHLAGSQPPRVQAGAAWQAASPAASAALTTAAAMGWVVWRSTAAACISTSAADQALPALGDTRVTLGLPIVRVPVLSNTIVSRWEAASRTSPPRMSSPLQVSHRGWNSDLPTQRPVCSVHLQSNVYDAIYRSQKSPGPA